MDFYPCAVTVGCVRANASVCPHVFYDVIIHVFVKGGVIEFIGLGGMKNWIVLCESRQYFFEVVTMYNN